MYDNRVMGWQIRYLREKKGMTQEVLSGLASISRTHLTMIENGQINASVDTLWRIAEALGLRFSELVILVEEAQDSDQ